MAKIPEDRDGRPWRPPPDPREEISREVEEELARLRAERLGLGVGPRVYGEPQGRQRHHAR